jgi:CRP-like cAMP-binding protein
MNEELTSLSPETLETAREITSQYIQLPETDVRLLASILKKGSAKKGEIFIRDGQVCDSLIYVTQGLARQFYYKNGHDVTEHFTSEGQMLYCIESLYLQEPTHLMAEALEPLTYYKIPYKQMNTLLRQSVGLCQWRIRLLEIDGVISQQKADSLRFETASERYERFVKEYPEAAKRAPNQHIASYLVMTRESLSRVRAGTL